MANAVVGNSRVREVEAAQVPREQGRQEALKARIVHLRIREGKHGQWQPWRSFCGSRRAQLVSSAPSSVPMLAPAPSRYARTSEGDDARFGHVCPIQVQLLEPVKAYKATDHHGCGGPVSHAF